MARFNPWLGTQVGSVGDLVSYRRNGKQVQRVRVRNIANPRTEAQAKNRAVLATMGAAYSYMQGIVDHSFQNKNTKSENMQEFQKLNQGIARALDNAPAFDAQKFNYNFKGESVLRPNPYAISRGTLPSVQVIAPAEGQFQGGFKFNENVISVLFGSDSATLTYQQVADLFGVELGSQLTFCIISDDNFFGAPSDNNMPASYGNFHFARVILAPDDGDGSKLFWNILGETYTVASPNSRNRGRIEFITTGQFVVEGRQYPLAAGIIVSNYNGRWLRSNTDMVVAADYVYSNGMAEVFNSYMNSEEEQPASNLYLNQSEATKSPEAYTLVGVEDEGGAVTPVEGKYPIADGDKFYVKVAGSPVTPVITGTGATFQYMKEEEGAWTYTFLCTSGSADATIKIGTIEVTIEGS